MSPDALLHQLEAVASLYALLDASHVSLDVDIEQSEISLMCSSAEIDGATIDLVEQGAGPIYRLFSYMQDTTAANPHRTNVDRLMSTLDRSTDRADLASTYGTLWSSAYPELHSSSSILDNVDHFLFFQALRCTFLDWINVDIGCDLIFKYPRLDDQIRHLGLFERHLYNGHPVFRSDEPGVSSASHGARPIAVYPLSPAQRRIIALAQGKPSPYKYNITTALLFRRGADMDALTKCLESIYALHPVLKTVIFKQNDDYRQRLSEHYEKNIFATHASSKADARKLIGDAISFEFALVDSPLCRFHLIRRPGKYDILILVAHHIISDGTSIDIIIDDLHSLYRSGVVERSAALAPAGVPAFFEYAERQNGYLESRQYEEDLRFFCQSLSGYEAGTSIPHCAEHLPDIGDSVGPARRTIHGMTMNAIKEKAREQKATLFSLLLTALYSAIWELYGISDIAFGIPVSLRAGPKENTAFGYFLNTNILRLDNLCKHPLAQRAGIVTAQVMEMLKHKNAPLMALKDLMGTDEDGRPLADFRVMFSYVELSVDESSHGSRGIIPLKIRPSGSKFDMNIVVFGGPSRMDFSFEYNDAFYTRAAVERLADRTLALLQDSVVVGKLDLAPV